MSTTTPKLGLFKYNPSTDGNLTFSITNALNNNWDIIDEKWGNGRNIGEIIQSTIPLTDSGLHLLDGSLLSGDGIYSDFVNYIASIYNANLNYFCSESDWQTSVSTYGACGKFVYNSTNNTVRLPKIIGFTESTIDATSLGNLTEAGLPNCTGFVTAVCNTTSSDTSSLYVSNKAGDYFDRDDDGGWGASGRINIDLSRSSSIYGNSDTVQPQSIKVLYYIVIANSTKTEIEVDIDNITTDLNGKADRDLSNVSSSNSFKNTIYNSIVPKYNSGYININPSASTSASYTAPANGYIHVDFTSYNKAMSLSINGRAISNRTSTSNYMTSLNGIYPVKVGDIIAFSNGYIGTTTYSSQYIYFVPLNCN